MEASFRGSLKQQGHRGDCGRVYGIAITCHLVLRSTASQGQLVPHFLLTDSACFENGFAITAFELACALPLSH
jgi:hypothetical protein